MNISQKHKSRKSTEPDPYEITALYSREDPANNIPAKTIAADGEITAARSEKYFVCEPRKFTSLEDFYTHVQNDLHGNVTYVLGHPHCLPALEDGEALVAQQRHQPHAPRDRILRRQVAGSWNNDTLYQDRSTGLENKKGALIPFDIDGYIVPESESWLEDPESAIENFIHEYFPPQFHNASFIWHFTATHGLEIVDGRWTGRKDLSRMKFRLYFQLQEPIDIQRMKALVTSMKVHCPWLDTALYNPAQQIYIRRPVMEGGPDPLEGLTVSGFVEREADKVSDLSANRMDYSKLNARSSMLEGRAYRTADAAIADIGKSIRYPMLFGAGGVIIKGMDIKAGDDSDVLAEQALANLISTIEANRGEIERRLLEHGRDWTEVENYLHKRSEGFKVLKWKIDRILERLNKRASVKAEFPTNPVSLRDAETKLQNFWDKFNYEYVPSHEEWLEVHNNLILKRDRYLDTDNGGELRGVKLSSYAKMRTDELKPSEYMRLMTCDQDEFEDRVKGWDEHAAKRLQEVEEALEAYPDEPPALTLQISAGSGKTTTAIDMVARTADNLVMLQPTQRLLDQTTCDVEAITSRSAGAVKGRGLEIEEGGVDTYCQRVDEANAMSGMGFSVNTTLCGSDREGADKCEFYEQCAYRQNMRKVGESDINLATHASARAGKPREVNGVGPVIIDEDFTGGGVKDAKALFGTGLTLSTLKAPSAMIKVKEGKIVAAQSSDYLDVMRTGAMIEHIAKESYSYNPSEDKIYRISPLSRHAAEAEGLTIGQLEQARNYYRALLSEGQKLFYPSMGADLRKLKLKELHQAVGSPRAVIGLLTDLIEFMKKDGHFMSGHLLVVSNGEVLKLSRLKAGKLNAQWTQNRPAVVMTATMPQNSLLEIGLDRKVENVTRVDVVNDESVTAIQNLECRYSATRLGVSGGQIDNNEESEKVRQEALRVVKSRATVFKSIVVVSFKAMVEWLQDKLTDFDNIRFVNFGATEGLNSLQDADYLMQIGSKVVDREVIRHEVMALTGEWVESLDMEAVTTGIEMRDGSVRPVDVHKYTDPIAQACHEQHCVAETVQALHRLRPVRPMHDRVIEYFGDQPIPMRMDVVRTYSDMLSELDVLECLADRGIFPNRDHMRKIYPDLSFDNIDFKDKFGFQKKDSLSSESLTIYNYIEKQTVANLLKIETWKYKIRTLPGVTQPLDEKELSEILGEKVTLDTVDPQTILDQHKDRGVLLLSAKHFTDAAKVKLSLRQSQDAVKDIEVPEGWIMLEYRASDSNARWSRGAVHFRHHEAPEDVLEGVLGYAVTIKPDSMEIVAGDVVKPFKLGDLVDWRVHAQYLEYADAG